MPRRVRLVLLAGAFAALLAAVVFAFGWFGPGPLPREAGFVVPQGATLKGVAAKLEREGAIRSADGFVLRARFLGSGAPIRAGEFLLPQGASAARILGILQSGRVIHRQITVPEGMPSVMVYERLMAQPLLTGPIPVPDEGTILPDTYDFERGEPRAVVLGRMQKAMRTALAELWRKRGGNLIVRSPQEAVTLASIVEKETGKPAERRMVAGLYSNRLRSGMPLQADPTIIYPITRGKPLGRRIRQSEIRAVNGYNTYTMAGLPAGPITNPGRQSIAAVLNPASTAALYMVADGAGGHAFASTLDEHNRNVAHWFAIRRSRGEM